jgi:hypothetical protein
MNKHNDAFSYLHLRLRFVPYFSLISKLSLFSGEKINIKSFV